MGMQDKTGQCGLYREGGALKGRKMACWTSSSQALLESVAVSISDFDQGLTHRLTCQRGSDAP